MDKVRNAEIPGLCAAVAAVAGLLAGPAAAAPSGAGFEAWLSRTTDLTAAQVVTVGAENVYSLELVGPRRPSGEVMALVRTEPLDDSWGAAHGFQSWDADLLIDCAGGRMRVVRSARYPQRNRQGAATTVTPGADWISPKANEPAVQLLAAACDPAFAWPLRHAAAAPGAAKPAQTPAVQQTLIEEGSPRPRPKTEAPPAAPGDDAEAPQAETVGANPAARYFVQVARGPSEPDARKALKKARKTLGPLAEGAVDTVQPSRQGDQPRYTARLDGFSTATAAEAACQQLTDAGQSCFVRRAASSPP